MKKFRSFLDAASQFEGDYGEVAMQAMASMEKQLHDQGVSHGDDEELMRQGLEKLYADSERLTSDFDAIFWFGEYTNKCWQRYDKGFRD
jgi:hypothetical protein